jgi:pectin methylesterase-like acyl-CoA thioesterase
MVGDFDILVLLPTSVEISAERYLKGNALLSYPGLFMKSDSELEALRIFYLKGQPALQADVARYIKGDAIAQKHVELYMRGDVVFVGSVDFARYIKSDTDLRALRESYLRGDVVFNVPAVFVKGTVSLVKAPNLEQLGNNPPANKPGVLSRQYLSVAAVKKEV